MNKFLNVLTILLEIIFEVALLPLHIIKATLDITKEINK